MKNQGLWKRRGDFALGKGFYIVLFLCVAAIGISGYYLLHSVTGSMGQTEPVGGGASVTLPDQSAGRPVTPAPPVIPNPSASVVQPPAQADQPDDPEPVRAEEPASNPQEQLSSPPEQVSQVFTWPVRGAILRDYSVEALSLDPTLGDWRTHGGLDIAADQGMKVLAISAGTVSNVYLDGLMGSTVVVDHGGGLSSSYCNLEEDPAVSVGETVTIGQVLGTVGRTAIAEVGVDSHLHLETTLNGQMVDPREYLPQS